MREVEVDVDNAHESGVLRVLDEDVDGGTSDARNAHVEVDADSSGESGVSEVLSERECAEAPIAPLTLTITVSSISPPSSPFFIIVGSP